MEQTGILYNFLVQARNNDKASIIVLCEKFAPLLKKYCYRLCYEDAYNDLTEVFLRIIMKIPIEEKRFYEDKYILSYIKKAMYHEFIQLNQKKENDENYICLLPEEVAFENILVDTTSGHSMKEMLLLIDMKQTLTAKEFVLFQLKVIKGYSDKDIAAILHISRQAVNKQINKMKPKLKAYINL